MNKETLESITITANKLREDLLFHPKEFDEKSAWMLILTFIEELTKYELERTKEAESQIYQ